MGRNKSSISKARSNRKISEFWDTRELTDYWDQTESVEFELDVQSEIAYFRVEKNLSAKISKIARQKGVSAETLLNLWLQEKVNQEPLAK